MKKTISLLCILSLGAAVHADYKNVKDVLVDFLALHKKSDKPLDYWIEQLIALVQHDKQFQQFITELKRAKLSPQRLQQAFKNHARLFDSSVKAHLIKIGEIKIKEAFEKRSQIPQTPIATLTPVEKAVLTIATEPVRTSQQKAPINRQPVNKKTAAEISVKPELSKSDARQVAQPRKTVERTPVKQESPKSHVQVTEQPKTVECSPLKQECLANEPIQQEVANEISITEFVPATQPSDEGTQQNIPVELNKTTDLIPSSTQQSDEGNGTTDCDITEHIEALLQHLKQELPQPYVPHEFNLESWKRLYTAVMQGYAN